MKNRNTIHSKKLRKAHKPVISVVMPVYNAAPYLRDSIDSILNQTYKHIECIFVDDASKDGSWDILREYAKRYPKVVKVLRNKRNLHAAKTVSRAIDMAKGQYLARMDADDVALPQRLEKQLKYLNRHQKTVAVGSQCLLINKTGSIIGEKKFPTKFEDIYKYIWEFCPSQQPTLMIAKDRLPKGFQYYDHGMTPVEDVELLFKLFESGKVENLNDYLLMYRIHGENSSLKNFKKSFLLTLISRIRGVLYYGYIPTPKGVLVTLAQFFAVFLLPQAITLGLYRLMKKINSPTPYVPRKRMALDVSKAL